MRSLLRAGLFLLVSAAACGSESDTAGPGGAGGAGGCTSAVSCTDPLPACRIPTCATKGVCGSALAPAGASCANGGTCDASGACLAPNGAPCTSASQCASQACTDGVCCGGPCTGACMSCAVSGSEGTCAPIPFPLDPDGECPSEGSCNGFGACSGAVLGVSGFGSVEGDGAYALATTAASVRIGGFYAQTLTFGGAPLPLSGLSDPYVAAFDGALVHAWSGSFGSPSNDLGVVETVTDLATDASDDTFATLLLKGQTDFGAGPIGVDGQTHAVVMKLGPSGSHLWSKDFGENCEGRVSVASAPGGGASVVTCFQGTVDFGDGVSITAVQSTEFAVVGLAADGSHVFTTHWGSGIDSPSAIGVDPNGNSYVAGTLFFPYDFGGGLLSPGAGGLNAVVVKLDASGHHVWSRIYGGGQATDARSLAVRADGLVLTGTFSSTVDFGTGPLTAQGGDAFVLRLDLDGNALWSRKIGGASNDYATANFDHRGNVLVTGQLYASADFAGLASPAGAFDLDVYAGKLAADGTPMWVRRYTTMGTGYDIAADAADNIFVTGDYNDTFGSLLSGNGSYDIFLLKLTP